MRTLLALYPGPGSLRQAQFRRHARYLSERGVRVVLADDYLTDADRACFDECLELPPAERVSDAWSLIRRYIESRRVDAVLAQSEAGLCLGALVVRRLGVPGIRVEAALACTSKYLTRRELARADVAVPAFALCGSARDVREFAGGDGGGYPLVLKGVASALSRLVTLVRSADEVDAATARVLAGLARSPDIRRVSEFAREAGLDLGCDPTRQFLAESFATGAAVESDGLVRGDEVLSFGVTEQVLSAPPRFYIEGYLTPAPRPPRELEAIETTSRRALAALGVAHTGYSIEMRLAGGAASVIEVNGRLGFDGGFDPMFETRTGSDPFVQALALALGEKPAPLASGGPHCALAYQSNYSDGVVTALPSAADLARATTPGLSLGLCVYTGERMHAPPHPDAAPHLAYALAQHPTSSREAYESARTAVDALRFTIEHT